MELKVSNQTVLRVLALAVSFVLAIWFIYLIRSPLTLIVVSAFLAIALSPPVNFLTRKIPRGGRMMASAISYLITIGLLGFFLSLLLPPIVSQTQQLLSEAPTYIQNMQTNNDVISTSLRRLNLTQQVQEFQQEFSSQISNIGGRVFSLLGTITSSLAAILTVFVLVFFFLVEGPDWIKRFESSLPKRDREYFSRVLPKLYSGITGYVGGQVLIATLAAISTFIVLSIMKIPFAVSLAALVGLFGLIPLIGATIGALVVIAVALFQSVSAAIIITLFFLVYQQLENNVFQPLVQSRTVSLSPLVVLIATVIGISVAGILGALLAIPIAGSIRVLLSDYLETRSKRR